MPRFLLLTALLSLFLLGFAQTPGQLAILSPLPGSVLQGTVAVLVNIPAEEFVSAELFFQYMGQGEESAFPIQASAQPIQNGLLAQWDTTTISDGDYSLRLVILRQDSRQETAVVENLRVRNYSPIETETPTPQPSPTAHPITTGSVAPAVTATFTPTASSTPPIPATVTPLPPNPAQLAPQKVWVQLGKGSLVAAAFFSLLGLFAIIHSIRTRH